MDNKEAVVWIRKHEGNTVTTPEGEVGIIVGVNKNDAGRPFRNTHPVRVLTLAGISHYKVEDINTN